MEIAASRALHGIPSRSTAAEPTSENAAIARKKTEVINPASANETPNSCATGAAAGPTTPAPYPKAAPSRMTPIPTRDVVARPRPDDIALSGRDGLERFGEPERACATEFEAAIP